MEIVFRKEKILGKKNIVFISDIVKNIQLLVIFQICYKNKYDSKLNRRKINQINNYRCCKQIKLSVILPHFSTKKTNKRKHLVYVRSLIASANMNGSTLLFNIDMVKVQQIEKKNQNMHIKLT